MVKLIVAVASSMALGLTLLVYSITSSDGDGATSPPLQSRFYREFLAELRAALSPAQAEEVLSLHEALCPALLAGETDGRGSAQVHAAGARQVPAALRARARSQLVASVSEPTLNQLGPDFLERFFAACPHLAPGPAR